MKNVLIITAHPSSHGHTHKIANAYKEASEEKGNTVEILDLYKTEYQLPFFAFENIRELPHIEAREKLQEKIMWANELIFVHPLWWGFTPAIMKNFLDHCLSSGMMYKYVHNRPVGLLTGRTAKVFITCGGPAYLYYLILMPFRTLWVHFILQFCGIKVTYFKLFGSMSIAPVDEAKFERFLEKVKTLA